VQGPPPDNQTQRGDSNVHYDSAARIQQVTTANTGAYTRYGYGPNYVQSWSSVNSVADEAYSVQFLMAQEHILAGGNHPGKHRWNRLVQLIYDRMGRAGQTVNPTETNGDRVPVGDDSAGWVYTQQLTIGKAGRWRPPT